MTLEKILKNKTVYIFDLDATLVDLEQVNRKAFQTIFKKYLNTDLTDHEYISLLQGPPSRKGIEMYLSYKNASNLSPKKLHKEFRAIKLDALQNDFENSVKLRECAAELLQTINNLGYKAILATSTVRTFTEIILHNFNLKKYFSIILTSEDVKNGKPNPEMYNLAIEKIQHDKTDAVIFEDSKSGIKAALNSGMVCIGFDNPGINEEYVKDSDYIIRSFCEVNAVLTGNK